VLYAYLGAAVVGAVLLVASILGAGHDHATAHDADHDSPALALLSIRVWTYILTFGGLTGLLLRLVAHAHEPLSGIGAALVGVTAAVIARTLIAKAAGEGPSGTVRTADLVGKTGDVVVPFGGKATGKVRVRVGGADVDLLATTDDGEPLERHDEVLVVEVREGSTAVVTRNPAGK
jgi:membrane protein implicated in regulation of membrane protease activity